MKRLPSLLLLVAAMVSAQAATWTADNGDGTFTNPLFYDEFSDPDLIRVGDDFYLTGTTMHTMPGLPVLHSKDLVNWELLGYACERLDLGPQFRLEGGREIYGQGFWAPSFRHHNGTFDKRRNCSPRPIPPGRGNTRNSTARSTTSRCCSTTMARSM